MGHQLHHGARGGTRLGGVGTAGSNAKAEDVKALVAGLYKAVKYTQEHPDEAYAIMAKGVGGYLSDPKELAAAAKGVRFYDQAMSEKLLGSPGKPGDSAALIKLANETASELQGKPYNVSHDELVDNRFVSPL